MIKHNELTSAQRAEILTSIAEIDELLRLTYGYIKKNTVPSAIGYVFTLELKKIKIGLYSQLQNA